MGDSHVNLYADPHHSLATGSLTLLGIKPRVHHGSQSVDAQVDHEATGSGLAAVRAAAAVSTVAFAQACAAEWPNSWSGLSAYAAELRTVVNSLAG